MHHFGLLCGESISGAPETGIDDLVTDEGRGMFEEQNLAVHPGSPHPKGQPVRQTVPEPG